MKNFIKLFFIFMLFSLIISGCIVVADPEDVFLYDFGLTGVWDIVGTPNALTIENQTGYNLTSGKYSLGSIEPTDWSTVTTSLDFSTPLSDNSSRVFDIGTGQDINLTGEDTIWIKINSYSDYLIGAFDYKASSNTWYLIVYTKN